MDTIARDLRNLRGGDRSGVVGHAGNFTREGGGVQSVARALTLLEIIADLGGEASLTDIAGRAGLNVSTCHHLLSTLVTKGYAARVDNRRSYALGARVLYLSQIRLLQVDLPRRAAPWIERANAATGEKIHLAFLQGNNVVKLVNRYARDAVALKTPSRDRTDAAHATATGKAILAWLSQDYLQRIVAEHGMKSFTTKTITDLETLNLELAQVRCDGYAMDREEFLSGVICLAAAIRDHTGAVLGALGASSPAVRATEEHLALLRAEITSAARGLSAELGAPPY